MVTVISTSTSSSWAPGSAACTHCGGCAARGSALVVDAGAGNGGVWHWNAYPGARVDSHWPNYEFSLECVWRDWYWNERFPGRDELCRYFDHAVDVLDLGPDVELGQRVVTAAFDPMSATWTTVLDDGRSISSRYVILAIGFAAQPYVPELPGLADFNGATTRLDGLSAGWTCPVGGSACSGRAPPVSRSCRRSRRWPPT